MLETPSSRFEREVLPPGGSVLDVGCGGGRAALALAPPAALIVGVDESATMLDQLEATASERQIQTVAHLGRWPGVADDVPVADVAVCHHVAYNVADIVPFLVALTSHARLAVVLELTDRHPQSVWSDAWRHFWGLERPESPVAEDLVAIVRRLGWALEVWRQRRSGADDPRRRDTERAVQSLRRSLCLPAERTDEVAAYIDEHPVEWLDDVFTLRWPGSSEGHAS